MRVAPSVSRRKFDRELSLLRGQSAALQQRGVFLVGEPAYPTLDLLFVPRSPLLVLQPATVQPSVIVPPGARITYEVPSIAARAFKARFDLTDYDLRAPSVTFLDYWSDAPLQYETMFRALEFEPSRGVHPVLLDIHPITHRPFLCLRGVREYHEHPQHTGDEWLLYRGSMTLFSAAMALWRAAIDLPRPLLDVQEGRLHWIGPNKL